MNTPLEAPRFKVLSRVPDVCRELGFPRSTLYLLISRGDFPRPIKLGAGRLVGWRSEDLETWLASRQVAA